MNAKRNALGKRVPETATERLNRLLGMVPWILANPGETTGRVADEFGITEEQLERDLELLFVCGTPGGSHLELIDAEWDSGRVYIRNADEIAEPMRLSRDEAVALTAGLQALPATGTDPEVVERTLAKLREAVQEAAGHLPHEPRTGVGGIDVEIDDGSQHAAFAPLREAKARGRRVHLQYYVETRDEQTERDVDLMRMVHLDGHWYVEGWCHRADAVRMFRLDRIESVQILEVDGTPPPQARPRAVDQGLFVAGEGDLTVVLEADAHAAWVADYYPHESVTRHTDHAGQQVTVMTMRVADPALVRRLVLQHGGALRVREPVQLAQAVQAQARAALAAY